MRVPFSALSMNQHSQAYGNYRQATGDIHCPYSSFVEASASLIDWNSETGIPWMGRFIHRNEWSIQ